MVFEYDLPRKIGEAGLLQPKFDSIIAGWYLMAGSAPNVDAAIAAFQALADCGFFHSPLTFRLATAVHTRRAACGIMDASRNRTGLEGHVDLAGVRFAEHARPQGVKAV